MARKWSNLNLPSVAKWLSSLRRGQGPPSLPVNYLSYSLVFSTHSLWRAGLAFDVRGGVWRG